MNYPATSKAGDYCPSDAQPALQSTIGERLEYYAQKQPEHPAFVSSSFAPLSYRELLSKLRLSGRACGKAGLAATPALQWRCRTGLRQH